MAVVRQQVTAHELLYMPDDGFRYELVRGELRQMTPAGNVHGRVATSFAWRLAQYVEENHLGTVYAAETGFRLATDPDTVRAPDVAFVGRARVEAVGEVEGFWPGAPNLAVEVVSPGDSYVIFSDGIEADYLSFDSGAVASISIAEEKARLVVA